MNYLTEHISQDSAYRNELYPLYDGVYTTALFWIETSETKGQRSRTRKFKPNSSELTEISRSQYFDLVFMSLNHQGLVVWHEFNLKDFAPNEVQSFFTSFPLSDYQRKVIDKYVSGVTTQEAPQAIMVSARVAIDEVLDDLRTHYERTKKEYGKRQLSYLRNIALNAPHMLPGTIEPFQLDLATPAELARKAGEVKITEEMRARKLEQLANPAQRKIYEQSYLEIQKLNEEWIRRNK